MPVVRPLRVSMKAPDWVLAPTSSVLVRLLELVPQRKPQSVMLYPLSEVMSPFKTAESVVIDEAASVITVGVGVVTPAVRLMTAPSAVPYELVA